MAAVLERAVPLGQKADWLVMAAWLLHLRFQSPLPLDASAQRAAKQAGERRKGLAGLRAVQALAAWLDAQPQLGRDMFVRGQPEMVGLSVVAGHEATVIEFLWATMALFDDGPSDSDAAPSYRPHPLDLHTLPDVRTRIMRLLPERPRGAGGGTATVLKRCSAWTSTFVDSLELAKAGEVHLAQDETFGMVHVRPATEAIDRVSR